MLQIEHVSHTYNGKQYALNEISFTLGPRGVVGLLGPNGAGKSTLINIVCGVLYPTAGGIFLNGYNLHSQRMKALTQIGFLPQNPPLYPNLSIEEYLYIAAGLRNIGASICRQSTEEVMEKCGIACYRKRLIKNLSGGYRQRVGIAQAIIHHPKIIILDEPINGLDPNHIFQVRELIKRLADEALIVLSTHILSEVEALCGQILMLDSGHLIANQPIEDFKSLLKCNSVIARFQESCESLLQKHLPGVLKKELLGMRSMRLYLNPDIQDINLLATCLIKNGFHIEEITKEETGVEEVYKVMSGRKLT